MLFKFWRTKKKYPST